MAKVRVQCPVCGVMLNDSLGRHHDQRLNVGPSWCPGGEMDMSAKGDGTYYARLIAEEMGWSEKAPLHRRFLRVAAKWIEHATASAAWHLERRIR